MAVMGDYDGVMVEGSDGGFWWGTMLGNSKKAMMEDYDREL